MSNMISSNNFFLFINSRQSFDLEVIDVDYSGNQREIPDFCNAVQQESQDYDLKYFHKSYPLRYAH